MNAGAMARRGRAGSIAVGLFAAAFLAIALYQFAGACQDWARALAFRYGLDYGEGIVWQQAVLMFGPQMYSPSKALPFIVFHYPPLYHFTIRALMAFGLDPLVAGRLISIVSAVVVALSVVGLILLGTRGRWRPERVVIAAAIGLMSLCLHPVLQWSVLMRVDMLAIALGLVGTIIFVRGRGSTLGTTAGLLVCVAAVFTKQTQLPAGIAVFLVALLAAPLRALVASAIAGGVGVAAVLLLQVTTGGFLQNIIGYNVNPTDLPHAYALFWNERENWALVLLIGVGVVKVTQSLGGRGLMDRLRQFDPVTVTRAVMLLHFVLACLAVLPIIKEGSNNNYFVDMLAAGCVLLGIVCCRLGEAPAAVCTALTVLGVFTAQLRHERLNPQGLQGLTAEMDRLTKLVAAQTKPVMSDDMLILMRAGKSVVYEPAIVHSLVADGQLDPSELLAMIRDHGFAFAMTFENPADQSPVTTAIRAAYPRTELTPSGLTIRTPP